MSYFHWLLIASATFFVLERIRPARPAQPALRPQLANDLFYLAFNGHFYAIVTAGVVTCFAHGTNSVLADLSLMPERGWLANRPFWLQFGIYFVISDFMQWCVHNLLHRIPWLWSFHKVHHSIHQMDWAGNFRFHWVELVVYKSLQYVPLLYLGGDYEPLLTVWVFATCWGHFNHSNFDLGIGPLAYLFNSPRMHLWHHDSSDEGGVAKNFGIVLSLWDWLFRTAYWPRDRAPARLGFPGDEELPRLLPLQLAFPLTKRRLSGPAR